MKISLLQLNIEAGRKFSDLVIFINKNNFDVIQLQEVTGGEFSKYQPGLNVFEELKQQISMDGELSVTMHKTSDPASYFGNATFFRKELSLLKKETVWLHPFREVEGFSHGDPDIIRSFPRSLLGLQFAHGNNSFWCLNTHLAWGPTQEDEPHKIEQGKILTDYVSSLKEPFILSGDFNVWKESKIVKELELLAINHAVKNNVTNTLNPALHRASHLFPQGLAVDFIFTHPSLTVNNFSLVDKPDLSDHYGMRIEVEI